MSAYYVSMEQQQLMVYITYSGLGMVQFHASSKTALCQQAKLRDDNLVELGRG
jgi:hypothetical protein